MNVDNLRFGLFTGSKREIIHARGMGVRKSTLVGPMQTHLAIPFL